MSSTAKHNSPNADLMIRKVPVMTRTRMVLEWQVVRISDNEVLFAGPTNAAAFAFARKIDGVAK